MYYIITDTHLGHGNMPKFCGRPEGFSEQIINNLLKLKCTSKDTLIHLGDVCWYDDIDWNNKITGTTKCKTVIVRGNHDKHSYSWYTDNGWDFCCETFTLDIYGKKVLFSHKPQKDGDYDVNIHGHFHNNTHHSHEPYLKSLKTSKHYLVFMEHTYQPVNLRTIINDFNNGKYYIPTHESNLEEQNEAD